MYRYYIDFIEDFKSERTKHVGVVGADKLTEAFNQIVQYYSSDDGDNIIEIKIYPIDVILEDEEMGDMIKEGYNP